MTSQPLDGQVPYSGERVSTETPLPMIQDLKGVESPELMMMLLEEQRLLKKKQEWSQWVSTEYSRCRIARTPFERQWSLNLAFTAGKQYIAPVDVPGQGFRLTAPRAPRWRVRMVVNKIRVAVRTECSKLTTSKPIPTVRPATNEDEDYSAAAVGEQLIAAEFATAAFESEYRSWIWWGVVCGTSFMKQYYDPSKLDYDSKTVPETPKLPNGTPIPDEILDKIPGLKEKLNTPVPAQGKICRERVTPFHIYVPDLLAENLDQQPYVIHVMTKSPLWVEDKYGFKANADTRASNTILDAATLITKGSNDHLDSVMVKEIWIKPHGHKDFPEGGMLTVINNRVVQHTDKWPYPFPEYPFYKYNGIPTGGFYSDSTVVDLIPVQKEYNKKRSQALEIQNIMGKPMFAYQQGSMNPKMISSEPGQSIPYKAGFEPPILIPGAEVPTSFVQELEQLATEFDDLSGQHEISRGQTTMSSLTSGTAIAYLQEQDDAKLNYQVSSIENACELLGKHYLSLAGNYWDEDRLIRTTGKNNTYEAIHWKRGILRGNTDVKIQTGSALPFSKAATQALLTELMQNGFLDPQTGLEMMNFGNMDKALDTALVDKRQAMRENMKMSDLPDKLTALLLSPSPGPNGEPPFELPGPVDPYTGQPGTPQQMNGDGTPFQPQPPVPVNSWDNHEQHIQWHNHYRKSQEFELLSEVKKQAFELHVQLHQIAYSSQVVNQQGQVLEDNSGQQDQGFGGEEEQYPEEEGGPPPSNDPQAEQQQY
jgi:hypothetical protein